MKSIFSFSLLSHAWDQSLNILIVDTLYYMYVSTLISINYKIRVISKN